MSTESIISRVGRERLSKVESNFEAYIAVAILFSYTSLIFYNILSRRITGGQITGSLEITMGAFAWVVWLSAAFAVRRRAHLRFTLIRERLSRDINYILHVFEWVMWIIITGIMLRFSITILMTRIAQEAEISTTGIPAYLLYLSVPVGLTVVMIRVLQQAVIITREYRADEDVTPDSSLL